MKKIDIEYVCFLNQSGYGMAAQNYLLALNSSNRYNIKLKVIGDKPARLSMSEERYGKFLPMMNRNRNTDAIMIYHCIPTIQRRVKKNKKNIGFSVYETFEPPNNWINILNSNDALMVPSDFNYRIFAHSTIQKPIYKIPHCLDFNIYNKDVEPSKKFDKFTFLFLGTFKERKGYKQLIEAWLREFSIKDNVQLLIKTDKIKKIQIYVEKIRKQLGITKGFAPILFESEVIDEIRLSKFIKSCDCFILPTMGEGFNIPGLQCMSLEVPVIITDFSGCKEYANEKTATLIPHRGFVSHRQMDGIPQFKNKKWAFISVDDIRKSMRYAIENVDGIKEKASVGYDYVKDNFNYEKIEFKFYQMLKELYNV